MNTSARIQYLLSFAAFVLIVFAHWAYLGRFVYTHSAVSIFSPLFFVKIFFGLLLLRLAWKTLGFMIRLSWPPYEVILALAKEVGKTNAFDAPLADASLQLYADTLTRGKTRRQVHWYRLYLPFCAFLASPRTQRGLQVLILIGALQIAESAGYGPTIIPPIKMLAFLFILCRVVQGYMDIPWPSFSSLSPPTGSDHSAPLRPLGGGKRALASPDALLLLLGFLAVAAVLLLYGTGTIMLLLYNVALVLLFCLFFLAAFLWSSFLRSRIGSFPYETLLQFIAFDRNARQNASAPSEDSPDASALWEQHRDTLTPFRSELPFLAFLSSPYVRRGVCNVLLGALLYALMSLRYHGSIPLGIASLGLFLLGIYRFFREYRNIF